MWFILSFLVALTVGVVCGRRTQTSIVPGASTAGLHSMPAFGHTYSRLPMTSAARSGPLGVPHVVGTDANGRIRSAATARPRVDGVRAEPPSAAITMKKPSSLTNRRNSFFSFASAVAGWKANGQAALAAQGTNIKEDEIIQAEPRGLRKYVFKKPKGFKRFANPVDPSGFLFRNSADTYFTFVSRAEKREGVGEFTPDLFVNDYKSKFVNSTGSSFLLIKSSNTPDVEDKALGVKYYDVEYVVRTQLGFSFDSLKSLHFLTRFAATSDSLYIMNCQAQDDTWDKDGPTLREVADSFKLLN